MKTLKNTSSINNFESLATTIQQTNSFFLDKVQRQVNTALTLRNWIIGYYIVEYEQSGKDKADFNSFKEAVYLAIDIFNSRKEYLEISVNPMKIREKQEEKNIR